MSVIQVHGEMLIFNYYTYIPDNLSETPFQAQHWHLDLALTTSCFVLLCCNIQNIDSYLLTKLLDTHRAFHRPNGLICFEMLVWYLNSSKKSWEVLQINENKKQELLPISNNENFTFFFHYRYMQNFAPKIRRISLVEQVHIIRSCNITYMTKSSLDRNFICRCLTKIIFITTLGKRGQIFHPIFIIVF